MTGLVIGIGNEQRRDDGFGPAVVRRLRPTGLPVLVSDGEPARLIEAWDGAALVVLVDAIGGGGPVGHWYELSGDRLAGGVATSSHGVSLVETLELARALDRLPPTVVVLAAVGADFSYGIGLSAPLRGAVAPVADRAAQLARDQPSMKRDSR